MSVAVSSRARGLGGARRTRRRVEEDPMSSRRSFLREVAVGGGGAPLRPFRRSALACQDEASNGEAYWGLVRAQFSFGEDKVPMNAANLCPSPRSVAARVTELTADIDHDCSFNNRGQVLRADRVARGRRSRGICASAPTRSRSCATRARRTTPSTTGSISRRATRSWSGSRTIPRTTWPGTCARRATVSPSDGSPSPSTPRASRSSSTLSRRRSGRSTKVLTITHVSNVSGIRLPAKEIVAAAHDKWRLRPRRRRPELGCPRRRPP